MEILTGLWHYAVPFLIVLTILVFVHEWGHYWVARRCGVRVEVFSFGMGPELWGWNDREGTRWRISLLPLGGYVKMFGDSGAASTPRDDIAEMTPEEKAVSFHHQSLAKRAANPRCRNICTSSQALSRHEPDFLVSVSSGVWMPGSMRMV